MRPRLLMPMACLATTMLVCGCSSNSGKIEGTRWSSQAMTVKGMSLPKGAAQLTFNKDGTLVYMAGLMSLKGTYSLGMGDIVTLHFEQEFSGRKDHSERVSIDSGTLTMTDSDGTAIKFDQQN